MRLLIAFYLALGTAEVAMSAVIASSSIASLLIPAPSGSRRDRFQDEEALVVALVVFALASLPLLAAIGLWRRWRLVRLILLGWSWWTWGIAVLMSGAALASAAGLTDGNSLGEPLWVTLVVARGYSAFAVWQYWVLTQPTVRNSFERSA